jgi:hypothetical protein
MQHITLAVGQMEPIGGPAGSLYLVIQSGYTRNHAANLQVTITAEEEEGAEIIAASVRDEAEGQSWLV